MIRLLHLRSSCGLYGADRMLLNLAEATRAPLEPTVGSIVRGEQDPLGAEATRRGLPHWRIQSDGRADLHAAPALRRRLQEEAIVLIHAHDHKSLSLGLLAARGTGIPVVATYHGDTAATPALVAYEALGRTLGNFTRAAAAVSAPLARRLARWICTAPVHHIPNGIPLGAPCSPQERATARETLGLSFEAKVIAVVGRLSGEKGHVSLLAAVRRLQARPIVLIAGEGPLLEGLTRRAQGLEVRWLGFVERTRQVYAAADVVVLPSLTEGLPLVALEAMAAGRPLLATAVGELPTLLREGAGLLTPPGDVERLASALEVALQGGPWVEALIGTALHRVRAEYGVTTMAERYLEALYLPALSGNCEEWTLQPAKRETW